MLRGLRRAIVANEQRQKVATVISCPWARSRMLAKCRPWVLPSAGVDLFLLFSSSRVWSAAKSPSDISFLFNIFFLQTSSGIGERLPFQMPSGTGWVFALDS